MGSHLINKEFRGSERLTTEKEVEEAYRLNDPDSLIARLASDLWKWMLYEPHKKKGQQRGCPVCALYQSVEAHDDDCVHRRLL